MDNMIYSRIAAIQSEIDFIGKDKQVQSGGSYRYRGVDQVLNTLHPLFAQYKVFAVPEVQEILTREERQTKSGGNMIYQVLKIKYTFYAEDGSNVSAVVVGEAMDSGDKVSNKCMSVAYKYACFQVLSIPTEETIADPDEKNEELKPRLATNPLTVKEIEGYGVKDLEATIKWIEDRAHKPMNELTDEEAEIVRKKLKAQKQKREAEEIPAPWDDVDHD